MGFPVIFKQERVGLNEKIFIFYKFRTMKSDLTSNEDSRITRLGKILRYSSLDEIPSFWNVLKGDISIVGPRPLLKEYLTLYSKNQKKRHDVKPGITGWAQVNGRNSISWKEKFKLDVWYVKNSSILLDIKILLKTVIKVIKMEGVATKKSQIIEKFNGKN